MTIREKVRRVCSTFCPLALACCGVGTQSLTKILACATHFSCSSDYPTLSYAAEWEPMGTVFGIGMRLTAIFCALTVVFFYSLVRSEQSGCVWWLSWAAELCGLIASACLYGLASWNMRTHHDAHTMFSYVFFVFNWLQVALAFVCLPRTNPNLSWRRLGKMFFCVANIAALVFLFLYLAAYTWGCGDPCAYWEALVEDLTVACQLLFMGTLWSFCHDTIAKEGHVYQRVEMTTFESEIPDEYEDEEEDGPGLSEDQLRDLLAEYETVDIEGNVVESFRHPHAAVYEESAFDVEIVGSVVPAADR